MCVYARYKHTYKECSMIWYESCGDVLTSFNFQKRKLRCQNCGSTQSITKVANFLKGFELLPLRGVSDMRTFNEKFFYLIC